MATTHFIDDQVNRDEANSAMWSNQIQTFDKEQLMDLLIRLEHAWKVNDRENGYVAQQLGYENFFSREEIGEDGYPRGAVDIERICGMYIRMRDRLCDMYHRSDTLGLLDEIDENDMKISVRINRLVDQVDDAWQIVFRIERTNERINNPMYVPINPESDPSIFRLSTISKPEELTPFQQALMQTLKHLYTNNIRRYKGQCCTEIKTPTGCSTRAWKPIMSIQEFVYSVGKKEVEFELWKNLTSRGCAHRDVITHLTNCKDMQFPDIVKNRHVWSFTNGIFIGKEWCSENKNYKSAFYGYDSTEFKNLDQTVVSCKYFDQEFPDYSHVEDWYDIPTPFFQSIMDYQGFDEEVMRWMYVIGGRLCFDVGDMDGWQVIPFLKGVARSGKSTLITKVFRKFYGPEDVRTLSNNVEKKFGLSAIYDSYMFIAPEVKNDLALEQAEFQSIVSGEDVSVAIKCEKAKSIEWKTPGILGGNEVPQWKDNSGSILRRILTFNFGKQVKAADTTLDDKLELELPQILQKCVRAYLEYAQRYANKDIWNVVPEYFKTIQRQVAMVTSTLENFLQSPIIKINKDACCPKAEFVVKFNQYCLANNLGKPKFNYDFYAGPFSQRDIVVRNHTAMYRGKMVANQEFIFGIEIIEEDEGFGADY